MQTLSIRGVSLESFYMADNDTLAALFGFWMESEHKMFKKIYSDILKIPQIQKDVLKTAEN